MHQLLVILLRSVHRELLSFRKRKGKKQEEEEFFSRSAWTPSLPNDSEIAKNTKRNSMCY